MSIANVYADVVASKPAELSSLEKFQMPVANYCDYDKIKVIGRGYFSTVHKGINKNDNTFCVLKRLKKSENHEVEAKKECLILTNLVGSDKIIKLYNVIKSPRTGLYTLIFEYFKGETMNKVSRSFSPSDIQFYMIEILKGIDYAHSCGIIHRDVKPQNILINCEEKKVKIIDWGLSVFYIPYKLTEISYGTLNYAAPEMLLGYPMLTYSVDIWSLGCIFGSLIFKKDILFPGKDLERQFFKILEVLGPEKYNEFLKKYNIIPLKKICLSKNFKSKSWFSFVNGYNKKIATTEALDLLMKMLTFDHEERISAKFALNLPYFSNKMA